MYITNSVDKIKLACYTPTLPSPPLPSPTNTALPYPFTLLTPGSDSHLIPLYNITVN